MRYIQLIYHVVLVTYRRERTITLVREKDLYAYIGGVVRELGGCTYEINGMAEHVHIVLSLPSELSLAKVVGIVKKATSAWIRKNAVFPLWNGWSHGYSAFTCSPHYYKEVIDYVKRQKEHHRKVPYGEEREALASLDSRL